MFLITVFIYY